MVFLACCIYLRCVKLLCVLPRGGHKVLQRNCNAPPGPSARKAGDPFLRPGELCLCPFRSFAQDAPAASFANGATTVAFPPPLRRAHANHAFLGHPADLWARTERIPGSKKSTCYLTAWDVDHPVPVMTPTNSNAHFGKMVAWNLVFWKINISKLTRLSNLKKIENTKDMNLQFCQTCEIEKHHFWCLWICYVPKSELSCRPHLQNEKVIKQTMGKTWAMRLVHFSLLKLH